MFNASCNVDLSPKSLIDNNEKQEINSQTDISTKTIET